MNPYLTDRDMLERILAAARRGVDVRLVVSETSNNAQASAALRHRYERPDRRGRRDLGAPRHGRPRKGGGRRRRRQLRHGQPRLVGALPELRGRDGRAQPDAAARFEERLFEPDIARSTRGEPPSGTGERSESWLWDKLTYFLWITSARFRVAGGRESPAMARDATHADALGALSS